MQTLLMVLGVAYVCHRLGSDPCSLQRALGFLGIHSRRNLSPIAVGLAGLLVVLALFVVADPEIRLPLMFIDSFGVDLCLTVCAVYLRHHLTLSVALILIPILKAIYRFGPLPGFWPYSAVLRSSPALAAYAFIFPATLLLLGAVCITDAVSR